MRRNRKILLTGVVVAGAAVSATAAGLAFGHGYTDTPPSRQALCAAGEVSDCGPIQYEPQSVEGPKGFPAAGPADGSLCSGGNQTYAQLDDPRDGAWPTTSLTTGANTFSWTMTAAHSTAKFEYFITKDGYDPTRPLTRDDLELEPFYVDNMDGSKPDHVMKHEVVVPQDKSGRHLILSVWTIADTVNAFYSCIDVDIDGNGGEPQEPGEPSASATGVPTEEPTDPGACQSQAWSASQTYTAEDVVSHGGVEYRAKWWTRDEEPGTTGEWGVWEPVGDCA